MDERNSPPAWPSGPAALFTLFAAAIVLAILLSGHTELSEDFGYLLMLVIGPFAGGLLWAQFARRDSDIWESRAQHILLLAAISLFLLTIGGLIYQHSDPWSLRSQIDWQLAVFLVLSAIVLAGWLPPPIERLLRRCDRWATPLLIAVLLFFCAVFAPLYQIHDIRISKFFGWIVARPLSVALLIAAWPLAYLLPRLPDVRQGLAAKVLLALTLCFALLLYDDGFFVEYAHYMPYVGPALHALNGGVPMVDVYSQYGILPWVLLWVGYHWMPETYGSAAIIIRFFTVAWYLTLPLIVYRLTKNKLVAMLLSAVSLLWIIGFHVDALDMNGLPSTQGYRYLLPMLVVVWLAWIPPGRLRSFGVFLLAAVGALWSVETATYVAGPPVALALLVAIRDRRAGPLIREALLVAGGIAIGHIALALYIRTAYGQWPAYGPFFEMLGFFKPADGKVSHWAELMPYGFGLWVPFAGILFAALAVPVRDAIIGQVRHPRAWSLIPATVLAIGELTYFVGRSYTTTLGLALMPFLVVCLVGIDALLERWRGQKGGDLRAERIMVALAMAGCFAFAAERFVRPFNAGASNATILRHCFTAAGCAPATVARRFVDIANERTVDIDLAAQKNFAVARNTFLPRLVEIEKFVKTYAADQKRVGILVDTFRISYLGIPAMADLSKWYKWPISSPTNDGDSLILTRRILASAKPHDGELLIIGKKPDTLAAIIKPLARKYATHCTLNKIDEGKFYDVVRTSDCHP